MGSHSPGWRFRAAENLVRVVVPAETHKLSSGCGGEKYIFIRLVKAAYSKRRSSPFVFLSQEHGWGLFRAKAMAFKSP